MAMGSMGCGSLWKWRDKSISRHGNMCIYILYYIYICIYMYMYIYIYNHDRLHRICPISTLRVWTEKKNLEYLG